MTKGGKLIEGIFQGETINTPSMLAVEDALDGLAWAERIGGLPALIERARRNLGVVEAFALRSGWAGFLAARPEIRSPTSVCLTITDPAFTALDAKAQQAFVKDLTKALAEEKVAYDIASYRDAPPGLRLWCGATVEASDLEALMPWLDWAFQATKARL
jgi:phosphoserine aminotransferase